MLKRVQARPELQKMSMWMPEDLLEEIDKIAVSEDVGRTAFMVGLMRYALKQKKERGAVIEVVEFRRKTAEK